MLSIPLGNFLKIVGAKVWPKYNAKNHGEYQQYD